MLIFSALALGSYINFLCKSKMTKNFSKILDQDIFFSLLLVYSTRLLWLYKSKNFSFKDLENWRELWHKSM